jgi:tetratricopeptide (TPR) repeat protein
MAMSFTRAVAVVAFLFCATGSRADEKPTPAEIAKAIKDLGDDKFIVRERASLFLWNAGEAAEAALVEAAKNSDLEAKRRIRHILDRFEYGIYPDTPKHLVDLIYQFRAGDPRVRFVTANKLLELDGPGYVIVSKFAAVEQEPEARRRYNEMLRTALPRVIAVLLGEDKLDPVDEILAAAMSRRGAESSVHGTDTSLRDYAAFQFLRGTLDKKIAQLSADPTLAGQPRNAEVLAYLHRANGDLARAVRAAEQSGDRALQRSLLTEHGQWGELLDRYSPRTEIKGLKETQILGYEAAFKRMAGRVNDFETTIADFRKIAAEKPNDSWNIASFLFLNDRPQDAMDVLAEAENHLTVFEFLKHQLRYREAFALADKLKGAAFKDAFRLEIARAYLLYEVGEKEQAAPFWERLRELKETADYDWDLARLAGCEARFGDKESAFTHAAALLRRPTFTRQTALVEQLFGDNSDGAEMWWTFLRRQNPQADHAALLKQIHSIMVGTIGRAELTGLVGVVAEGIAGIPQTDKEKREKYLLQLSDACLARGLEKESQLHSEAAIALATSTAPLMRLADALAAKKKWQEAAALYGKAWEKDKRSFLPLFLEGRMLADGGEKAEGEKWMKLAHWLPLAQESSRYSLAEALTKRGMNDLALREWEILNRTGDMQSVYLSNAQRRVATARAEQGRFLEAAALNASADLVHFGGAFFFDTASYLRAPSQIHRLRARGLISAGKIDEGLQEVRLGLSFLPASANVPIDIVPLLEKAGRQREADELFGKVLAHYEQQCADYPRYALPHNESAWLCARCRRQLDKGLKHAKTAVELNPRSATYFDTLAEVHFQRGDQAKALEAIGRSIDMDPKREFYRRQLKRFQAGDRFAEVPSG